MADEKESGGAEWMQKLWRPAMGWMYMIICLADMLVFPVLWSLLQAMMHMPITQWNPLTLQGAGLFHIAMGAVLGISAFGRTQEKLAGTAANPTATSQSMTNNTNMAGVPAGMAGGMGGGFGGSTGGFGSGSTAPTTGFQSGAPAFGAPTTGGFGGSSSFGSPAPSGVGGGGFGSPSSGPVNPPPSWGTTPISTTPAVNAKGQKVVPQDDFPPL